MRIGVASRSLVSASTRGAANAHHHYRHRLRRSLVLVQGVCGSVSHAASRDPHVASPRSALPASAR
eukprot:scaffold56526_cov69-Phaeocystis_antarctica.AAC.3